jgi:amidase
MADIELYRLTASQAVNLIRKNDITVEQYARSLLVRISGRDPAVKAWAHLNPEMVLEQARLLDMIPPAERAYLHGLPIGVKDIINTKGRLLYMHVCYDALQI